MADVANYVLYHFGNNTVRVTIPDVARVLAGGPKPLIARLGPFIAPAMSFSALILLFLTVLLLARRRRRAT